MNNKRNSPTGLSHDTPEVVPDENGKNNNITQTKMKTITKDNYQEFVVEFWKTDEFDAVLDYIYADYGGMEIWMEENGYQFEYEKDGHSDYDFRDLTVDTLRYHYAGLRFTD